MHIESGCFEESILDPRGLSSPCGGLKCRAREWGKNGSGGGEVREGRLMCESGNEVGGQQLPTPSSKLRTSRYSQQPTSLLPKTPVQSAQ